MFSKGENSMFIFTTVSKENDEHGSYGFKSGSLFDTSTGIRYHLYLDLDTNHLEDRWREVVTLTVESASAVSADNLSGGLYYSKREALEFWHKLRLMSHLQADDDNSMFTLWVDSHEVLDKHEVQHAIPATEVQS